MEIVVVRAVSSPLYGIFASPRSRRFVKFGAIGAKQFHSFLIGIHIAVGGVCFGIIPYRRNAQQESRNRLSGSPFFKTQKAYADASILRTHIAVINGCRESNDGRLTVKGISLGQVQM
eukprot:scaffold6754_cov148-Amphora_coffeaeformis.AAC.2